MTDKQPTTEKTVPVTLKRPHRHRGIEHPANARIDVRAGLIDWLARQGVIEPPQPKKES